MLTQASSYTLGIHSPKKDYVKGIDSAGTGASEVTLRVGSTVNVNKVQFAVGSLEVLRVAALTQLAAPSGAFTVEVPMGGGSADVTGSADVSGTWGGGNAVAISMGATPLSAAQSHFVDRTITRLIEALLEDSK